MERSDLSSMVTHWIKADERREAFETLKKILISGRLLGGSGFIRGTPADFDKFPDELRWRYVRFEPDLYYPIDWSWEGEWRVLTREIPLDPYYVSVVVPDQECVDYFRSDPEYHIDQRLLWDFTVLDLKDT